ncbi:hypothetical protein [Bordetella sp. BOR01]|uniref:hypothetical protein n=1 Tax=Bordetella sp. BOR01 TaxID=2854779 RepID=UPI001C4439B4|nr:hypothetical protein [Bordetella sp. BOR01]MBV7482500.1 hypothetical protein [Bordetella sp. BOR01]
MDAWTAIGSVASLIAAFYAGMAYHRSRTARPCVLDAHLTRREDGDYLLQLLIHPGEKPMQYQWARVQSGEISRAEASWPDGYCVFTPSHGFSEELAIDVAVPSDRLASGPTKEWLILRTRDRATISLWSRKSFWASRIKATVSTSNAST